MNKCKREPRALRECANAMIPPCSMAELVKTPKNQDKSVRVIRVFENGGQLAANTRKMRVFL
jgi:hypothetical protein